ncbi:MAG: hypothetical protein WEC59_03645 [Salibacteraceae bacterium]
MLISIPPIFNVGIAINYQVDQKEYLQRCENKDKPLMHCNGKCVLAKKLMVSRNNEAPDQPKIITLQLAFFEEPVETVFFKSRQELTFFNDSGKLNDFALPIDHPPQFS